jgi:hypothetical protein
VKVVINAPTKRRKVKTEKGQAKPGIQTSFVKPTTATPNIFIIPRPAGETITAASVPVPQLKKLTTSFTSETQTEENKPTASFIKMTKETATDAKSHDELMQEHYAQQAKKGKPEKENKEEAHKLLKELRRDIGVKLEKLYKRYEKTPKNGKIKSEIQEQEDLLNEVDSELSSFGSIEISPLGLGL